MALMVLREGFPSNMLYADRASTMWNFVVVVAWHGGSPRLSTSCTNPRGSTLSLLRIPLSGRLPVPASLFRCPFCQMSRRS